MIKSRFWFLILVFLGLSISISCNKETPEEYNPDTSYWSVKQFIMDQYSLRVGTPSGVKKTVTLNGKTDSSYLKFAEVDWATIFKIFGEADISNPKFYGKYKFDNFDDNFIEMSTMTYSALDPKLFVRRLDVNYDNISGEISLVYIETNKKSWFTSKQQKLSYYVGKKIVIQESEQSTFSKPKELVVEFSF